MIVHFGVFGHVAGSRRQGRSSCLALEVQAAQQVSAEGLNLGEWSLDSATRVPVVKVELHAAVAFLQVLQEGFASGQLAVVNHHGSAYKDLQVDSKGVRKQGPKINPLQGTGEGKCTWLLPQALRLPPLSLSILLSGSAGAQHRQNRRLCANKECKGQSADTQPHFYTLAALQTAHDQEIHSPFCI